MTLPQRSFFPSKAFPSPSPRFMAWARFTDRNCRLQARFSHQLLCPLRRFFFPRPSRFPLKLRAPFVKRFAETPQEPRQLWSPPPVWAKDQLLAPFSPSCALLSRFFHLAETVPSLSPATSPLASVTSFFPSSVFLDHRTAVLVISPSQGPAAQTLGESAE